MREEVQERVEDYLGLERYIEQLRLQRSARLPTNSTPQQKRVYGMATLFHTATPHVADPRPEFSAQLYQRLRQQIQAEEQTVGAGQEAVELAPTQPLRPSALPPQLPVTPQSPAETPGSQDKQQFTNPSYTDQGVGRGQTPTRQQGKGQFRRIYSQNQASQPDQISSTHSESADTGKRKRRDKKKEITPFPRRTLFTAGAVAASLLAAAGVGAVVEHSLEPQPPAPPDLHPHIRGEEWHPVTSVEQLGKGPTGFSTNTSTGYIIRQENGNGTTPSPTEQIIAFSAACTHLGCIVQWEESTRQFPCPCHGRTFDAIGDPVYKDASQPHYMSLPRLETKIENGNIYVKVPKL